MDEERKRGWSFGMWLLLAVVAFFLVAVVMQRRTYERAHRYDRRETVNNARQIGIALFEFETEYGSFPDETTATKVRQKTGSELELENSSSNDYFRQLIAAGIATSERIFYSDSAYSKKPHLEKDPGDQPLGPGSVGFGYLINGKSGLSTEGNPARPVVCAPLAFDGKTVSRQKFDPDPHDGIAVVLRIDNSVTSLPIDKKTKNLILATGKSLLDTGPNSVWGSHEHPGLVPPLPKQ